MESLWYLLLDFGWLGLPFGVPMVSPWCPIGGPFALFVELVGTCGIPLGAFGHTCVALGVLVGILRDLGDSFWIPWGTCWKHFGILWHPFGNFLGTLGVYRVCPKGGGAPLGRPDWGSLVILWGFLGNLWEPFVGSLGDRQTERHTDRTRQDQTRPDQRLDQRPEQRPDR